MAEPYGEGVPTVAPQGAPANDYQRIDASPSAFGAPQAQALQRTGADLEQTSDNAAKTALLVQDRYNQVTTQDVTNGFLNKVQGITWGNATTGTKGIYQLQGADAMSARQPTEAALEAARQESLGTLTNDAQRIAFNQQSQFYMRREMDRIGEHVDGQMTQYQRAVNAAGVDSAAARAAVDPGDLDTRIREGYMYGTRSAQGAVGQTADPVVAQDYATKAAGRIAYSALDAMAERDPTAARQLLATGTAPSMDGKSRIPIASLLDQAGKEQLEYKINAKASIAQGSDIARNLYTQAIATRGSNLGPIADKTLPAEAQKFLPVLSGGEGNYSSPAPKGDQSGAPINNNRYQFLSRTWATEAPKAGVDVNDHSPEAQDKVAWNYSKNTYATVTGGRDLQADIAAGGHEPTIALALNKVWPSLPGGSEQNTPIDVWSARMRGAIPTTNDARGPIPAQNRLNVLQQILAIPDPTTRAAAMASWRQIESQDDHAADIDASSALNEWGPKIAANPASVNSAQIWADNRLQYHQKELLTNQLMAEQSGRAAGDGSAFGKVYEAINAPLGTAGRVNTTQDLIPFMGNGLTFSGLEKLQKVVTDRDKPDAEVQKAAMVGFRSQIEGVKGGMISPGPVSQAKWASFLGAALPMIQTELKDGKKTMAEIVGPTGPIAKMVPSYLLRPDEIPANLGIPAPGATTGGGTTRDLSLPVAQTDEGTQAPPAPVAGHWYIPRNGALTEVPAGTPLARVYGGGAVTDPGSWNDQHPAAPH